MVLISQQVNAMLLVLVETHMHKIQTVMMWCRDCRVWCWVNSVSERPK